MHYVPNPNVLSNMGNRRQNRRWGRASRRRLLLLTGTVYMLTELVGACIAFLFPRVSKLNQGDGGRTN